MKTERHPCGCISERDRERWIELCALHRAEFDERHARAAADYRARHQDPQPSPVQRELEDHCAALGDDLRAAAVAV